LKTRTASSPHKHWLQITYGVEKQYIQECINHRIQTPTPSVVASVGFSAALVCFSTCHLKNRCS